MNRCRLWTFLFPLLPLVIALVSCQHSSGSDGDESRHIEIVSDRTFIFTGAGESAQIQAVVVGPGSHEDASAELTYVSSHPDIVSVDAEGFLTAQTGDLGSAVITISSEDLQPVVVTAVIAELTSETHYVESGEVISVDADTGAVVLVRNERTDTLQVGDVLLSGDRAGLLCRVTSFEQQESRLLVQTVPADLTEAFENIIVEAEGAPVDYTTIVDGDGVVTLDQNGRQVEPPPNDRDEVSTDSAHEMRGQPLTVSSIADMPCELNGRVVTIDFTGASIQQRLSLVPHLALEIRSRTVARFDLYVDGLARVTATIGQIDIAGGITGSVECKLELEPIPLAFLPVTGPLGLGPTVTPVIGVDLSLQYSLGTATIFGAQIDSGVRALMGLGYTAPEGFRVIREYEEVGDGVQLLAADGSLSQSLTASISPYFGVTIDIAALLGPLTLTSFSLIDGKVGAGAELSMSLPISSQEYGYAGPRWQSYVTASASLQPLVGGFAQLERLLSRLGIPAAAALLEINLTIIELQRVLAESPEPTLDVRPDRVPFGEAVTLEVAARGAVGANVEFLAFKDRTAPPIVIAQATTSPEGDATATWTPGDDEVGVYDIAALVYDGVLGGLGFPYATHDLAQVEVGADVVLNIDPSELTDGQVGVPCTFSLLASNLPPDLTTVTFDWDFGDGQTTGTRSVPVDAGQASTVVSNAFEAGGTYRLLAEVKDGAEPLARSHALIAVGQDDSAVVLTIHPLGITGETGVECSFDLEAEGIPGDVTTVTFDWDFGDGTTGSQSVPVAGGRAAAVVSNTYDEPGVFGLLVVAVAGAEQAFGSASISIGGDWFGSFDCSRWCRVFGAVEQGFPPRCRSDADGGYRECIEDCYANYHLFVDACHGETLEDCLAQYVSMVECLITATHYCECESCDGSPEGCEESCWIRTDDCYSEESLFSGACGSCLSWDL